MATLIQQLAKGNYTLSDFKSWGQGPGTALSTFGWSADGTNGTVNWSTITATPLTDTNTFATAAVTNFRGAYSNTATYAANDYVTFNGATWICISGYTASATTPLPGSEPVIGVTRRWQLWPFEIWQSAVTPTIYLKLEYYNVSAGHPEIPNIRATLGTSNTDVLTLTSVANASGGNTVYTGTIAGGGTPFGAATLYSGKPFTIAGFTNAANNGTFTCVSNTTTTLTLNNSAGVAETHAATATSTNANVSSTSVAGSNQVTPQTLVATATGITAVPGQTLNCYFSGDNGNRFGMLFWPDDLGIGATLGDSPAFLLVIERSLSNTGSYYTTPSGAVTPYVTMVTYAFSNAISCQSIVNTTGSTWVATTVDAQLNTVGANWLHSSQFEAQTSSGTQNSGSGVGNMSVPCLPVFPLVGWVGNPLTMTMSLKVGDSTQNGTFTQVMYGSTRTYLGFKAIYTQPASGLFNNYGTGTNNALAMRYD